MNTDKSASEELNIINNEIEQIHSLPYLCGFQAGQLMELEKRKNEINRGKLANLLSGVDINVIWGPDIELKYTFPTGDTFTESLTLQHCKEWRIEPTISYTGIA